MILRNISRFVTAIVFLFSAIVKGVDPLGTAYRLDDYFIAYGMEWAMPISLGLSIALCLIEFIIGFALLLNLRMRKTAWALLLIMLFFTLLTLYDAIYEPVSDCGCFGDAIKLTNWETFYKNVVLMVFTLVVFIQRRAFTPIFTKREQNGILLVFAVLFIGFSVYNYRNLPMIDFRPWKVGNKMTSDGDVQMDVYLRYRNTNTGETKEYLSPNYPWNDSVWLSEWEFVDQRIVSTGEVIDHGLFAEDENGIDHTDYFLGYEDYIAIAVVYDFQKANAKGLKRLLKLGDKMEAADIPLIILTSSLPEEVMEFRKQYDFHFEVLYADAITLKTMIRSNPGLMLFRDGKVVGKWAHRNILKGKKAQSWIEKLSD